ncbi:septal ring lytic transglycosylase RlpA [Alteromonas sp. KS69]|jgi:rare lipoprotein A|uniref:septal ring lytic transglycosylase RlpA family protein n=1 Tax=Alteromonas sp. KS69 TaxID=2109917 RepID=UPI000F889F82|nr:septal ring lytic transglycosylase RlpA family protein [Alteromonas sp. KS69]RUP81966.1 septal ring lytic transglycosylase RlpA [Alteromonas sp. KS69]|tara:strand:+ start:12785 stop:13705 length:921 start_codon:yes stop_codon:yes gene_type:complete
MRTLLLILLASFILAACKSAPSGRYTQHQDTAPNHVAKVPETLDAVPKYEAYRMFNSRPYKVLGKHYTPLTSGKGFEEVGYASWYGQKFHGHLTSNGETYNMFAMSAAHKTLPLPSYVRVTNLNNDKQAIVRVNDRGPFHDNRIIDLSYAAAVKLGYHNKGTAKVKIEVIHFDPENNVTVGINPTVSYDEYIGIAPLPSALASTSPVTPSSEVAASTSAQSDNLQQTSISLDGYFIQVAALSNQKKAESISNVLSALYQVPTHMPVVGNVYKLQLGPIEDEALAHELLEQLKQNGYPQAYKIKQTL